MSPYPLSCSQHRQTHAIVGIFYAVDRCLESPVTPRTWTPQANRFDCAASGVAYLSHPLGIAHVRSYYGISYNS